MSYVLFLSVFGFYLWSACGALAPYRDSGEMAVVSLTLGVAHPPGYPLYTLLGKVATFLSLGNVVYRVNVLSALGGALAVLFAFKFFRKYAGLFPAAIGALLLATSPIMKELSAVSEMYSWGIAMAALLFYLASSTLTTVYLISFLFGLGLGIRMDIVLIVPALLILLFPVLKVMVAGNKGILLLPVAFFLAGFSVFLYVYLRSKAGPFLDWRAPDTLAGVWEGITRKSYGGTLDLISSSYKKGENFWPQFKLYLKHLSFAFTPLGAIISVFGLFGLFKNNRRIAMATLTMFAVTGPVFLFAANMPPNPHAVAIVEAHYLLPDFAFAVWVAAGIRACQALNICRERFQTVPYRLIFSGIAVMLVLWNALLSENRADKRWNLYDHDYAVNLFRSVKPHSVVVLKEDVQLFSAWAYNLAAGKRRDVVVIAHGLSGSEWYKNMMTRWPYATFPDISRLSGLNTVEDWNMLYSAADSAGYSLLATVETPLPEKALMDKAGLTPRPYGLVSQIQGKYNTADVGAFSSSFPQVVSGNPGFTMEGLDSRLRHSGMTSANLLRDIYLYRDVYNYSSAPDFFAGDLIGDYSAAYASLAQDFMNDENWEKAVEYFACAGTVNENTPGVYMRQGYCNLMLKRQGAAITSYKKSVAAFNKLLKEAEIYRSLPDVVEGLRREAAEAWTGLGVVYERNGNKKQAREYFQSALRFNPDSAQSYYNLAVTYWGEDWHATLKYLETACKLNASFCSRYEQAKQNL